MPRTPPRRGLRVAAAAVALLLALGVCEAVLRWTHWGVYEARVMAYHFRFVDEGRCWVADPAKPPEIQWDRDPYGRLPPDAIMTFPLNSHGLRGPEPDPSRSKVLLVGDSFTFGEGVAWEDTFAARVESAVRSRAVPPPQVVVGALPGYGTEQEALRLPGWLADFKPRAVVVVFVPNDPIPLDDEIGRDDLLRVDTAAPTLYLARLVRSALGRASASHETETWYESYYLGERADRWDAARRDLVAMRSAAHAEGAKFGVVIFPLLHRLDEMPFARLHETVALACRNADIPVLDLAPAFAGKRDSDLWIHPTDHHPDALAHRIAAEAMAPFVDSLVR